MTGTIPSAPLEIRPVRPEEYAETGALVEASYTAGGILDNDRGYGAHVRDVAGRAPDHPVLVAVRDGRIVGSVTITPFGSPQSELARDRSEVEFRFLAVAPEAWGTGVAQALVAAVEAYAAGHGAQRLVLCVIESNEAAQRLYARLGFERDPDRDWIPVPEVVLRSWRRDLPRRPVGQVVVGLEAAVSFDVTDADTAMALGSGDVPVLATPRVIAWLEAATVACLASSLDPASTSVGTRVEVEHVAASPVGATVVARASVSYVDGRLVRFEVAAEHTVADAAPVVIATGRITRVIVDRSKFLARL